MNIVPPQCYDPWLRSECLDRYFFIMGSWNLKVEGGPAHKGTQGNPQRTKREAEANEIKPERDPGSS